MWVHKFTMIETLAVAICLLLLGRFIKGKIKIFEKFFIPAPVIGGVVFSIITLIGHNYNLFSFEFDGELKNLLMVSFFTTIGFLASLKMLKRGGMQVLIFLLCAVILVIIQNGIGVFLAKIFNLHSLIGVAAGSVPLTGGHGTSAAFGPVLEKAGATSASLVAVASATFGLVAGCVIGGPIGKLLMAKHKFKVGELEDKVDEKLEENKEEMTEKNLFQAVSLISIAMGIGVILVPLFTKTFKITLPLYLGPMVVAAVIRNIVDWKKIELPMVSINAVGNISLQIFLAMALMTMKLWELAPLAGPLAIILLVQTIIMGLYAYFVTFNMMGRDYDAAVLAVGHCGFGMGATPNAMANMESFTAVNGASPTAFFALPLVGSLFIDFVNASIITVFINIFG